MGVNQVLDLNPDSPWCHLFDCVLVTQRVTISMCKSHILWLRHVTTSSISTSHPSPPVTATCYCDYRFWLLLLEMWVCKNYTRTQQILFFFFLALLLWVRNLGMAQLDSYLWKSLMQSQSCVGWAAVTRRLNWAGHPS